MTVLFFAIAFLLAPRRPLDGIDAAAVGRGQIEAAQNALEEADRDLDTITASYLYTDAVGYHFMDQETFETVTLEPEKVGEDRGRG